MTFDSRAEARRHKVIVAGLLDEFIRELSERAMRHDDSKFMKEEYELRDRYIPELRRVEYGSAEYDAILRKMKPAIEHHHRHNRHHPEHHANGVGDMNLFDLVEMFCDWCAATKGNGKPLIFHRAYARYKISDQLRRIFENTIPEIENSRAFDEL